MRDRAALAVLAAVVLALVLATGSVDLPRLSGGQFWSDGATYYAMAWSLAEDGDLRYEVKDVLRVRREYPIGPEGIFLKRASGGFYLDHEAGFPWLRRVPRDDPRIYFAKAFAYPLAAAPFVRLFGTRGLLLTNARALCSALALGYLELRRRTSAARALALSLSLFLATVTPLYLLWPQPELFNLALVTAGLVAWSRGRGGLAAALLALAAYSKPYNVLLALPVLTSPLVASGLKSGVIESVKRGVILVLGVLLLFGLNAAMTGEVNYQGGERKTFYGRFPLEAAEVSFGNSGIWMTTDHLGPLVEGEDEAQASRRTGPLRAPGEIRASFLRNLGYFWIGRFGGAVPYYLPSVFGLLLFLTLGPRDARGLLALVALLASYLFYIWMIPDNWYGGGGTVGNRYFLNLLPLFLFLVPRGREGPVAVSGALGLAVLLAPILVFPLRHSLRPGDHATSAAFRAFPAELTMLNDLSVFTERWRWKRPYGDTEGDPHRKWPADPKAYYLYFTDDGTFGRESGPGGQGLWVKGGERAEVILRALEPVRRMSVGVTGGPVGDELTLRVGRSTEKVTVGPGETRTAVMVPGHGFPYYDTFVYVLELSSARGGWTRGDDRRMLGTFVRIELEVDKRPVRR